jgi:putative inorganic carbon (HCO3(-)) transporter
MAALICGGVLVLSQSRSALMALAVIIALMLIFRWKWGWLLLLALLIAGAIVFGTVDEATRQGILLTGRGSLKWDQRIEIWSRAVFMIRDFPFTGIGMGSFREVADLFYPFFLHDAADIPHAHNLFLQVAVDLGIPGLMAWLSILASVIAVSWRVYRQGIVSGDRFATGIGVSLLCSQAALIVHGMTDAVTWGMVRPAPVVWALWGLAIAAWNVKNADMKPINITDLQT